MASCAFRVRSWFYHSSRLSIKLSGPCNSPGSSDGLFGLLSWYSMSSETLATSMCSSLTIAWRLWEPSMVYELVHSDQLWLFLGHLVAILVTAHSVCLLNALAGLVFEVAEIQKHRYMQAEKERNNNDIYRSTCFYSISPYIFAVCVQIAVMSAISADLLFSIAAPLR